MHRCSDGPLSFEAHASRRIFHEKSERPSMEEGHQDPEGRLMGNVSHSETNGGPVGIAFVKGTTKD